jgi:magnesium transporter
MMQIYYKAAHDKELHILSEPRDGCWIHCDEATQEDLDQIARLTSLDQLELLDALDKHEMPRLERLKQNLLVIARYPSDQEVGLYTATLTMILCPHYFITISPQKSSLVRNYLAQPGKISTHQKSKLLIYLLLKITQDFGNQVKRVRTNVIKQESEIENVRSDDIISLTKNEDVLNQYLSALMPMRSVLQSLTSGKYFELPEKDQELIEDLLNASTQSEVLCDVNLKTIRSLRESFQIIFTNNVNKTIKLLTALTIIFSIPTVISSLYGMNVKLPLSQSPYAFLFIVFFIGMLFILAYFYFQRKGWL